MKPYILPAVIAWFDAVQKTLWVQSFSTFSIASDDYYGC